MKTTIRTSERANERTTRIDIMASLCSLVRRRSSSSLSLSLWLAIDNKQHFHHRNPRDWLTDYSFTHSTVRQSVRPSTAHTLSNRIESPEPRLHFSFGVEKSSLARTRNETNDECWLELSPKSFSLGFASAGRGEESWAAQADGRASEEPSQPNELASIIVVLIEEKASMNERYGRIFSLALYNKFWYDQLTTTTMYYVYREVKTSKINPGEWTNERANDGFIVDTTDQTRPGHGAKLISFKLAN